MLINESYFTSISVGIAIVFFIVIYQLLKKRLKEKMVRYGGLVLAIALVVIIKSLGTKVYIIEENLHILRYRSFGSFTVEIEAKGGAEISCTVPYNSVGIVNKSKKTLVIDEIVYGMESIEMGASKQKIQGYSFKNVFLSRGKIDIFYDQEIPDQVDGYTTADESRYWLHVLE